MSDIAQRIASLSPEKRALLEKRLAKKNIAPSRGEIPRLSRETNQFPLSFAQQRLWLLEQLAPGLPMYNMSGFARFSGPLDRQAVRQCLAAVVARHETLRTTFTTAEGLPVQVISPDLTVPIDEVDLSGPPGASEETLVNLAVEEARQPFDLTTGPLCRIQLVCLAQDDHAVVLTMHHIISDGVSIRVLFQDAIAVYEALVRGREPQLPELPIQYADFAVWQRKWLQGERLEQPLRYWKAQLGGDLPVLQLPTDRPRPAMQTFVGARQTFGLPPVLTRALRELSQREGVTLFMVLLAAFQTLLSRSTGQEDILVGSPIANRNRSEVEPLIGFFVNTLVLRTDLSGNPTFRDLLKRVQQVALGAYAHDELPFEKLVEELQPERHMSHTPLFQVLFGLQSDPTAAVEMAGLTMHFREIDSRTSKCDLTLNMTEKTDTIEGYLEYNTDLFDDTTMTRLLRHFQAVLQGVVANPACRLADIPLLTDEERREILVGWNDTRTDYPNELTVHQLFERQAAQRPDAPAVSFAGQQLTYGELNERANRLAHYLRTLGVGPERFVAICLERSADLIVGILAILKAGGTYVPLDPTYPQERLAYMLEDTRATVLLTQEQLRASLPTHRGVQVVSMDMDAQWEAIARQRGENPANHTTPDHLAYVMYTSGSTGNPKGIGIPHRAINRLVFNTNYLDVQPDDRMAQAANASFDAATFEFWGALLHGALVVGISKDVALSPHEFAAQLREQGITTLFLTTALFNQLAREVPDAFATLRHVLFGGEAVDPRWVREVLQKGAPARLLHVYGPTESTTYATWYLVREVDENAPTIPIGYPLSNTTTYVLDQSMQPVPIGVTGELYLGGDGLARGYHQRPALTAERFVPDPFSRRPGARLYRTGDLVRCLPDGAIVFLGRTDHQVKIRGFRIELGEIEAALASHPAVRETVVLAREDAPGERRLVAYIVPAQVPGAESQEAVAPIPAVHDLRAFLKERLPDYMIPAAFITMDALPLTPNGKVDRRKLPAPGVARPDLASSFVAPSTPVETMLASIWGEVLKLERVGVEDNFFDLGGYSLAAVQVIARVRETFQVELPLRSLFEIPTVAGLSRLIEEQSQRATAQGQGPSSGPALVRVDRSSYRVRTSGSDQ
ncbi:MAG: amino acid adenylation domain-containing protein [Chloroflexaceae bacterium]|nr:amino acid adenylation domain-containing protein [Chloroflexaceae bacterium]